MDLQGNRISLIDGRGLTPLSYAYNMLKIPCYQNSFDSGEQRNLSDVGGRPLSTWDAEDRQISMAYDVIRRPLKKQITEGRLTRILEIVEYGEGIINDRINNNRGQVYRHSEGSGRWVFANYDFKSNLNYSHQYLLLAPTATDPDWAGNPPLETNPYTITTFYDALNRVVKTYDPKNNSSLFYYNKSGALTRRQLNNADVISSIEQNARGQRKAIWYANGSKTSYEYDAKTFRLRRLTTKDSSGLIIHQDLYYYYDPVGNITLVKDLAQQTLFFNNSVVSPDQDYTYDALYRLIEAKGRELKGTADFGTTDNWDDGPWKTSHKGDGNAVQTYRQLYTYDEVGNMLSLQHIATVGSYTRSYAYDNNSNQLLSTTVGSHTYNYSHDARGNMDSMAHLSVMNWNRLNELSGITRGTSTANYQYSGGQRVRKWVVKDTITTEERIYLGDFEIYRKFESGSLKVERTTVHISDDTGRIAMQEKRTVGNAVDDGGTDTLLTRYIYSNHLQSAALELDEAGAVISYEEYHPYGTTSYQATNAAIKAVAKRYRYTGKERDEESGLYYHGARYYVPWLCRWTASDPMESKYGGMSPYNYGFNNPIIFNDPSGNSPDNLEEYGGKPVQFTQKEVGEDIYNVKLGYNEATGAHDVELLYERQDPAVITGNQSTSWYTDLGFNESGHYRNEYSADGFSDPSNYVRFLDNASGSIWNMGVDIFNSFKNFSLEGLSNEVSASYNYYSKTSNADIWSDTKAGFISAFSDIRTYENLAPSLLLKMPSSTTTVASFEFKNITTTATQTVLNPKEIHFMQSSIKNTTGEFTVLGNAQALKSGTLNPEILRMNVWQDANSKIWTLDNRRLAAFKLSGLQEAPIQWANPNGQMWKMTTTNKGASIWLKFGGGSGATVR